ncbi:AAA family ATPase [Cellulomonas fengjieae]|uniref:ATPase n=1 Tax=Cellulomonas fengjieae TaxID=2819978 RepID=A0ABS3SK25_9CELL|nr:ATPase [Cellulomonas fengjieae]MBO3086012.1 ATPase [Cellulomonas fengjieae]QVI65919.1 ATPase [Cellulomonas fengjieae]
MDGSELLVIGGRSGVGKSSVANALHALLRDADVRHAVIEGDALDLAWPPPWEHRLSMRNLAAVWANYRELGYHRLVYTNTVSVLEADELAAAMGDGPRISGVLLTAADEVVDARLAGRESGDELAAHVERSARAARRLHADAPAWMPRVATDGRTPTEIARTIAELVGWVSADHPGPAAR